MDCTEPGGFNPPPDKIPSPKPDVPGSVHYDNPGDDGYWHWTSYDPDGKPDGEGGGYTGDPPVREADESEGETDDGEPTDTVLDTNPPVIEHVDDKDQGKANVNTANGDIPTPEVPPIILEEEEFDPKLEVPPQEAPIPTKKEEEEPEEDKISETEGKPTGDPDAAAIVPPTTVDDKPTWVFISREDAELAKAGYGERQNNPDNYPTFHVGTASEAGSTGIYGGGQIGYLVPADDYERLSQPATANTITDVDGDGSDDESNMATGDMSVGYDNLSEEQQEELNFYGVDEDNYEDWYG